MKKLFLIDSMAYIFRSFFAIRHMSAPDGTPTNATYGFIKAFEKILKDFNPENIAAVFDAGSKTFRNDIYPEYKANRSECPEDLKPQFDIIKEYLKLRGIPLVIKPGFEADDLIGTLASQGAEEGMDVYICTGDKDMMQLLKDNVKICQTHKDNLMVDTAKVQELIGVRADQVIDYLAMCGDASDNVPGLPGIGPKTASKLLTEFGDLETFFQSGDKVKGKKVLEAIDQHQELGRLSRTLVTIKCDVELEEKPLELVQSMPDVEGLELYFEKYGMRQMKTDMERIRRIAEGKGNLTLDSALQSEGSLCKVDLQTLAFKPQENEIISLTVDILEEKFDLLKESGCKTMQEALLKYRDAFSGLDFVFDGDMSLIKGKKISDAKKTELTFDYLVASWLFDSSAALKMIDQYHNSLIVSPLYEQAEFNKILSSTTISVADTKPRYKLVKDEEMLDKCIETMKAAGDFAFDVETTSLRPFEAKLVGIGVCAKKKEAWYVPLNGDIEQEIILSKFKTLLEDDSISVFGQNIKYDYEVMLNHGIRIANISFDTLLASFILNPSSNFHDLDSQAIHFMNYKKIPTADLIGKGKNQITMDFVAIEEVCKYCCEDVDVTFQLKKSHEKELKSRGLLKLFKEMDLPLVEVLGNMEAAGIYVDETELAGMSSEFEARIQELTTKIYALAGKEFNIASPKQLGVVLFEDMGLKAGKKTATGYSTDASVLEELAITEEIACLILDYRSLTKLKSTYVDSLPNEINPQTGRIHSSFSQATAATGRLASTSPNLQNIPTRTAEGKRIRSAFKPKEGCKFLACDYSQIELRIMAHLSEDPKLLEAFNKDHDIHSYTASLVFDVPQEEVTKEQRYQSKAVNFGIIYGQGPFGLAKEIGVDVATAKTFISNYFMRYPNIQNYMQQTQALTRSRGYAETAFGRRRFIPEINHSNGRLRSHGERISVNSPMQGTAADIIKIAMIKIHAEMQKRNLASKMLLQIHDELLFEVPDSEMEEMKKMVSTYMTKAANLKVKLKVDVAVGSDWSQCD
ncbi:MAG: DNA polymerase I [Lentisphaerales bacterium]|nr:DNA polymerase I [Lentisphaerales bacterium]